jgi:hypothetical protein
MAGNGERVAGRAFRYATLGCWWVAYLKARFPSGSLYQPFKRLATTVKPRWGYAAPKGYEISTALLEFFFSLLEKFLLILADFFHEQT